MQIDELKMSLVDKIMSVENKPLLERLGKLFSITTIEENLTAAQIEMLEMAKDDIAAGNYLEDDSLTANL